VREGDDAVKIKNNADLTSLRVLIIEDEPMTRVTLVETLRHMGVKFVASASDATSALKAGSEFKPDAIFCDIDLGAGPHGVDVAHALRGSNPDLGVICLSTLEDPRLKNMGARGLPPKAVYLRKAEVNRSGILLEALLSCYSDKESSPVTSARQVKLTDIQIELLQMIASGYSNTEIARKRGVAVKSTENAIARLAKTLGIKDNTEANQRVLLTRHYFEIS
jgi:DNA-binding NarL/FixJ family response regulator